jgi:hypothetical protein
VSTVSAQHDWAVILAAGDGTRLAALTRDINGVVIPKQFCSLRLTHMRTSPCDALWRSHLRRRLKNSSRQVHYGIASSSPPMLRPCCIFSVSI